MNRSRKILIVDDHAAMRLMLRTLLEDLHFRNIVEADGGRAALDALRRNGDIGFVITDCNMPEMDGIGLLRAIRAERALHRLPVLMVSAEMRTAQILAAHEAGVDGYLVKPFTARALDDGMARILDRLEPYPSVTPPAHAPGASAA